MYIFGEYREFIFTPNISYSKSSRLQSSNFQTNSLNIYNYKFIDIDISLYLRNICESTILIKTQSTACYA